MSEDIQTEATAYWFPFGTPDYDQTDESRARMLMPTGGSFTKLLVKLNGVSGDGKSYTFTLMKNGEATDLVVVVSGDSTTQEQTLLI